MATLEERVQALETLLSAAAGTAPYNSQYTGPQIDSAIARAAAGGEIDKLLANKANVGYGFNGDLTAIIYWDDTDGTKFESAVDEYLFGMGRDISRRFKIVDYPACIVDGNGGYADIYSCCDAGTNTDCIIVHYAVWTGGKTIMAFKQKSAGIWYPWEYVNPPMILGVEYRTTERYLGKPVYVKLVDCGALPNATYKYIEYGDSSCRPIFGFGVTSGSNTFPSINYGSSLANSFDSSSVVSLWLNVNAVTIACGGDRSIMNAYVFVKYWKSTD